ncbi:hypothetical protein IHE45_18G012200 [Dioscorea alata]|uniref:Uncharacterized protein n=1 Tax=Dioscorea alata TaxID=55571 RepID=A0ACB7U557_DIOAL|nr:hypothetical protein IHE45_18G012200 [Dioscorea alata]
MSVFGGDSWASEAHHRKRRVDDLMLSSSSSSSSYMRLSNGKYACLVCPHRPVLDSPISLSMHNKGSRHIAAETRLKEREISREAELNKRLALSAESKDVPNSSISNNGKKCFKVQNKPLIEHTRKVIFEMQSNISSDQNTAGHCHDATHRANSSSCFSNPLCAPMDAVSAPQSDRVEVNRETRSYQNSEFYKLREKELKFTAAGWKRDGNGKWYKDENAEFDSDEEDPNECLK